MADALERKHTFSTLEDDVIDDEDLTYYAKLCYWAIARHVGKERTAFPSYMTIGKKASISERQAQRGVKELVEAGYITKETRINPETKGQTSNLYTLTGKRGGVTDSHRGGDRVADEVNTIKYRKAKTQQPPSRRAAAGRTRAVATSATPGYGGTLPTTEETVTSDRDTMELVKEQRALREQAGSQN